jgi:hypothetical protein
LGQARNEECSQVRGGERLEPGDGGAFDVHPARPWEPSAPQVDRAVEIDREVVAGKIEFNPYAGCRPHQFA